MTELVRRGQKAAAQRDGRERTDEHRPVLIRMAREDDRTRLSLLAELDSAPPLSEPTLMALVEGRVWAAVSLADGRAIADPFLLTASAMALLRVRADQLLGARTAQRRAAPLGRVRRRVRV